MTLIKSNSGIRGTIAMLFAILDGMLFGSCSDGVLTIMDPIGSWEKMKWEAMSKVEMQEDVYIVGAEADTLYFACSNYDEPWISDAFEDGMPSIPDRANNDIHRLEGSYFSASIKGNELSVFFPENTTADTHSVTFSVMECDVHYTFRFLQAAPANKDNSY